MRAAEDGFEGIRQAPKPNPTRRVNLHGELQTPAQLLEHPLSDLGASRTAQGRTAATAMLLEGETRKQFESSTQHPAKSEPETGPDETSSNSPGTRTLKIKD